MHRLVCVAALLGACSPDTCDQNVVRDIAGVCSQHSGSSAAFTCPGGGSGVATIQNPGPFWQGTFTFTDCATTFDDDTLKLTGTVTMGFDGNCRADWGSASSLTIRGTVAGCGAVDETCALGWGPTQGNDSHFYRSGTVCGRQFP